MKTQRFPSSLVIELNCNEDNFMEVGSEHLLAMSAEICEQIVGADWLRIRFRMDEFEGCLHFDGLSQMCWFEADGKQEFESICKLVLNKYEQPNVN
ncbi:DUF3630 family protein [Alginatibacterium sediminis]|uniref:DUF3630 family protein n=1 Tax=Alginatibacterium sediminis TaxID=2164068 RepID=UPI00131486C6|nr:DUF3630 family protein [Alginatibacterium sediminis]